MAFVQKYVNDNDEDGYLKSYLTQSKLHVNFGSEITTQYLYVKI